MKAKFDMKKLMKLQKSNPKKFYMIIGGVVLFFAVGSMFIGDGGGGDPYGGGAIPTTQSQNTNSTTGQGFSLDAGLNMQDEDNTTAPDMPDMPEISDMEIDQDKTENVPDTTDQPTKQNTPKHQVSSKQSNQKLIKAQVEQLSKFTKADKPLSGDGEVDALISRVDELVRTVIASYDLSGIRGDALKGTTTQEELMRRTNNVLDMLTSFQKKRTELIEATKGLNAARNDPRKQISVEIQPIKHTVSQLQSQLSSMQDKLKRLESKQLEVEKNRGVTISAAQSEIIAQKNEDAKNIPKLMLIMKYRGGYKANLKHDGTIFEVTKVGQHIGDWEVKDMTKDYLVLRSDINHKYYMINMSGSKEVRVKRGGMQ